ncbi:MAG: glycosyltransferase family 39 protein, partial [Chloroflexi bacterium]|nr:glycosyltransferase family 39 protein [Chloroflexota bacterium]
MRAVAGRLADLPPRYLIAGVATGLLAGVGLGLMLINGEHVAAVVASVLAALVGLGVRIAAPASLRRPVAAIVGLSFAMHVAAATVIYFGSLAAGRGGFVTGDDASYANLSWAFARYLAGDPQPPYVPPAWAGDEYLFGTWVYLESAIFFVFGPRVLLPLLLNAALSSGLVLLLFDLCRRLFGSTAALVAAAVIAFYPSLMLWSSLNLKDALALFLIGLCLWCLARFNAGARWSALAGASAVLLLMESLRWYVFIGLAIIVPIAVALAPRLSLV